MGTKKKETPALRLEWRSPAELAENPKNWRTHPAEQLSALSGAIAEVGWAGACLYNEATGRLIDGHARRKVALEQGCERVPVLVGSWTEEQEAKILLTLDPLAGMAQADAAKLDMLLREVNTGNEDLAGMLAELAKDNGILPGIDAELPNPKPQKDPVLKSECFVEIYASREALAAMQPTLDEWSSRDDCTINIQG